MFYMRWTIKEIGNLHDFGVFEIWTEVDETGLVKKELGFDERKKIVYKIPSDQRSYGFFDNQLIAVSSLRNDLSENEFKKWWN